MGKSQSPCHASGNATVQSNCSSHCLKSFLPLYHPVPCTSVPAPQQTQGTLIQCEAHPHPLLSTFSASGSLSSQARAGGHVAKMASDGSRRALACTGLASGWALIAVETRGRGRQAYVPIIGPLTQSNKKEGGDNQYLPKILFYFFISHRMMLK